MQLTVNAADVLYFSEEPKEKNELIRWLDEQDERYIIVFEEKTPFHQRVYHCKRDEASIRELLWKYVFLEIDYFPQEEPFFAKVAKIHEEIRLVASDFKNRGIDRLQNLLRNSKFFEKAREGKDLFGAFSQIPAIICGAGSSLHAELTYLQTLKDRALLFGGGNALSILTHYGIQPHFGGLIDPYPKVSDFIGEVPIFFQSRVHPEKLEGADGPLLWVPGGGNDFFEEEHFNGGWNVATFLAALATHMGCNPIILVGVDLIEGAISKPDWLLAADWLSNFAKEHPEVTWINASKGLVIENFEKAELHEISFEQQDDLKAKVHSTLMHRSKGVMKNFDEKEILSSLTKVSSLCEEMLKLLEKLYPQLPEKNGDYTLLKFDIEHEIAFIKFCTPVWDVWRHVIARKIPQGLPDCYGIELNKWIFIKGICDDARKI